MVPLWKTLDSDIKNTVKIKVSEPMANISVNQANNKAPLWHKYDEVIKRTESSRPRRGSFQGWTPNLKLYISLQTFYIYFHMDGYPIWCDRNSGGI